MKQSVSPVQLNLLIDPGVTDQFPEFHDVVHASVYSCSNRRQFKAIAADLDMSPSELSRKLADNPNDPVHFPLKRLPELIRATGDLRPIYWLMASFLENDESRQRRLVETIGQQLPQLLALVKQLKKGGR